MSNSGEEDDVGNSDSDNLELNSVNLKEAIDLLSLIETSVDEKVRTDMNFNDLCLCKQILECAVVQKKRLESERNNSSVVQDVDIVIDFVKKKINACFKLKKGHLRPVEIASYLQLTTTEHASEQDQDLDRTIEVI